MNYRIYYDPGRPCHKAWLYLFQSLFVILSTLIALAGVLYVARYIGLLTSDTYRLIFKLSLIESILLFTLIYADLRFVVFYDVPNFLTSKVYTVYYITETNQLGVHYVHDLSSYDPALHIGRTRSPVPIDSLAAVGHTWGETVYYSEIYNLMFSISSNVRCPVTTTPLTEALRSICPYNAEVLF